MDHYPEHLAHLLEAFVSKLSLSQEEADYVIDRLSRIGVFEDANNWGGIRCLYPHVHGDGVRCVRVGSVLSPMYVKKYGCADDGMSDLFRIAHHATLSGPVEDIQIEITNVQGYRSVESTGPNGSDVVGSFVDRLDGSDVGGIVDKIEDKVTRTVVQSFCRGVISDDEKAKKAAQKVSGFIDDLQDKIVNSTVVSFCRGRLSAMEKSDKLSGFLADKFGPSPEAQKKVEEVAAQWAGLKKRMDADPKIEKMLRDSYDHWIKFWDRYNNRNDFWVTIPELTELSTDVRAIVADVNAARANVENRFVQDLPDCKPGEKSESCRVVDIKSEDASKAQAGAQAIDDRVKDPSLLMKDLEGIGLDKWKLLGASAVAAVLVAVTAKAVL